MVFKLKGNDVIKEQDIEVTESLIGIYGYNNSGKTTILKELDKVIDDIRQGKELDIKYRNHELKGKFKGFYECHIQPDWLLIYLIENDILTLTLVDTGSHADIFKM